MFSAMKMWRWRSTPSCMCQSYLQYLTSANVGATSCLAGSLLALLKKKQHQKIPDVSRKRKTQFRISLQTERPSGMCWAQAHCDPLELKFKLWTDRQANSTGIPVFPVSCKQLQAASHCLAPAHAQLTETRLLASGATLCLACRNVCLVVEFQRLLDGFHPPMFEENWWSSELGESWKTRSTGFTTVSRVHSQQNFCAYFVRTSLTACRSLCECVSISQRVRMPMESQLYILDDLHGMCGWCACFTCQNLNGWMSERVEWRSSNTQIRVSVGYPVQRKLASHLYNSERDTLLESHCVGLNSAVKISHRPWIQGSLTPVNESDIRNIAV